MSSPSIQGSDVTATDAVHTIVSAFKDAENALSRSRQSLREVLRVPSQDASFIDLRWSLVSEVMQDRKRLCDEIDSLLDTTGVITIGCRNVADHQNLIAAKKMEDSYNTATKLKTYYADSLTRLKNINTKIDAKLDKGLVAANTAPTELTASPGPSSNRLKLLIFQNLSKLRNWFSKIISYSSSMWPHKKHQDNTDLSVDRADLLVLALASRDIQNVHQNIHDVLVCVDAYNHFVLENTEAAIAWFRRRKESAEEIFKSSQNFFTMLSRYKATLDAYEILQPVRRPDEARSHSVANEESITEVQ